MKQKLLLYLDALLDTRLGTLSLLYPEETKTLLNKQYTHRLSDEFNLINPTISDSVFKERYKQRDIDVLINSAPTAMSFLINDMVSDMERMQASASPEFEEISVDLNIYPYELDNETAEEISVAVSSRCGILQKVNIISVPHSKMTFEYIIEKEWTTIVMYDFQEWLESIGSGYKDKPPATPTTTLIVPALLKRLEDARDVKKRTLPDGRVLDPFETTTACFADIIGLIFIPVEQMSLYLTTEE